VLDNAILAELAALRAKHAALETQVAAERQRALQAEADKKIAEAKVSHLEQKDTFMASTVNSWKESTDVERKNWYEHIKLQSKQVEQLVAANNERAVNRL
jgi:hypothetical protein